MTSLAPLSLDDLTYEDLAQLAVRRIPAASGGRWTHHEPVDSGVTLLELFAFLLDQQMFVLDQVPDSLTHAILALLGEAPKPAATARTVVALTPGSLAVAHTLQAETTIRPEDPALVDLVFSTRDEVHLLPVDKLDVFADGALVSDRLERGEAVSVMTQFGAPGAVEFEIQFGQPITAADIGQTVALAVILDGDDVAPEWGKDAVDVPAPGPLHLDWSAMGGGGRITEYNDGTGGLRRSGLIRLTLPVGLAGADRLRLVLSTAAAAHAAPPRLKTVAFGAAIVRHGFRTGIADTDTGEPSHDAIRVQMMQEITSLLPISGQVLDLPSELTPAIGPSIRLRLADQNGVYHDWAPVADLGPAAPVDRVFTFDRALGRLSFGDGYTGRVPAPATGISITAELGGGPEGNHAAGMTWGLREAGPSFQLTSIADARGGAEPEALPDARSRIAGSLARRHRAVTAEDYVSLVETADGVGPHRAHVMPGHDPAFPCLYLADTVTVFVVPRTGPEVAAPLVDDGALSVFRARLQETRMLTTRVFVRRPAYRPVAFQIDITSATGSPGDFADTLRPVFSDYLHPAIGGPDGIGWPFGRALRPSEFLRVAEAALPEGAQVERVTIRLNEQGGLEEDCTELVIGPADLVRLDRLVVRVHREAMVEATL